MNTASANLEFEKAKKYRDIIDAIKETSKANARAKITYNLSKTSKEVAETAMQALCEILKIQSANTIECFDISHISGSFCVASMVHFENGEPEKNKYRRFKIKSFEGNDDYRSMKEVVGRRYKRLKEENKPMPDIVLIDGGKGQLGIALEVIQKFGYANDIISLAERLEEVFVPHQSKSIYLPRGSYSLRLLQLARDEAHRFAITYNRQLRSKGMYKGGLQAIKGVGPTTRKILLSKFRTLENIKNATLEELQSTKGISKTVAKNIYNVYHEN
jgi:excinuclease ABC subunit C